MIDWEVTDIVTNLPPKIAGGWTRPAGGATISPT